MKSYLLALCVGALGIVLWTLSTTPGAGFDASRVLARGRSITSRSWEYGTLVQALLEFHDPNLTVFAHDAFPNGMLPQVNDPVNVEGLALAKDVIWTNNTDFLTDGEGSAADPASLGTAALLLGRHDKTYFEAARRQAEYLLNKATSFHINATHSAISHREDVPELWGDFIYMVPPFLAYHGVASQDMRFLKAAVLQCELYNDVLRTNITLTNGETCRGLWRHIISDPPNLLPGVCCSDTEVWLTSNAWAVAGMTRVLATVLRWQPPTASKIDQSKYEEFRAKSKAMLTKLITSMLECTMKQGREEKTGLLKNYLDGPAHRSAAWAYGDAAGTALMASAIYRLAVLLPDYHTLRQLLAWADKNRLAVAEHVHDDGRVGPVADVGQVPSKTAVNQTSEGQSMVVLMYSAWRDCMDAGVCSRRNNVLQRWLSW